MLRAGCEQRFIDVANWILGATWNAKGLGVNTTREEGVQPCEQVPARRQKSRLFFGVSTRKERRKEGEKEKKRRKKEGKKIREKEKKERKRKEKNGEKLDKGF